MAPSASAAGLFSEAPPLLATSTLTGIPLVEQTWPTDGVTPAKPASSGLSWLEQADDEGQTSGKLELDWAVAVENEPTATLGEGPLAQGATQVLFEHLSNTVENNGSEVADLLNVVHQPTTSDVAGIEVSRARPNIRVAVMVETKEEERPPRTMEREEPTSTGWSFGSLVQNLVPGRWLSSPSSTSSSAAAYTDVPVSEDSDDDGEKAPSSHRLIPRRTRLSDIVDFDADLDDETFEALVDELRELPFVIVESTSNEEIVLSNETNCLSHVPRSDEQIRNLLQAMEVETAVYRIPSLVEVADVVDLDEENLNALISDIVSVPERPRPKRPSATKPARFDECTFGVATVEEDETDAVVSSMSSLTSSVRGIVGTRLSQLLSKREYYTTIPEAELLSSSSEEEQDDVVEEVIPVAETEQDVDINATVSDATGEGRGTEIDEPLVEEEHGRQQTQPPVEGFPTSPAEMFRLGLFVHPLSHAHAVSSSLELVSPRENESPLDAKELEKPAQILGSEDSRKDMAIPPATQSSEVGTELQAADFEVPTDLVQIDAAPAGSVLEEPPTAHLAELQSGSSAGFQHKSRFELQLQTEKILRLWKDVDVKKMIWKRPDSTEGELVVPSVRDVKDIDSSPNVDRADVVIDEGDSSVSAILPKETSDLAAEPKTLEAPTATGASAAAGRGDSIGKLLTEHEASTAEFAVKTKKVQVLKDTTSGVSVAAGHGDGNTELLTDYDLDILRDGCDWDVPYFADFTAMNDNDRLWYGWCDPDEDDELTMAELQLLTESQLQCGIDDEERYGQISR